MNSQDENIRATVNGALTAANIDVRNLAIEVTNGHVLVKGTVPSTQRQKRMVGVLSHCLDGTPSLDCAVGVRDVAPSDSSDGSRPLADYRHLGGPRTRESPPARPRLTGCAR